MIAASANPLLIWSNDPEIVEGDAFREARLLVVVGNLISGETVKNQHEYPNRK